MDENSKWSWQKIISKKLENKNNNIRLLQKKETTNNLQDRLVISDENELVKTSSETVKSRIKIFINEKGTITIKPSSKILAKILYELDDTIYDVKLNEWRISCSSYEKIKKSLKTAKFVYNDIPKGSLNLLSRFVQNKNVEVSGTIYDKMFAFQREAISFAINRGGRVLLGDDMGLGKTIQALGIAYYYKLEWPLFIIAPASLLDNWVASIKQFLGLEARVIRSRTDFGENISIMSYDMCSKYADIVKSFNYNVVIADECHYIKSATSKRTKSILPIMQSAGRLILMSGTPAVSRPLELYTIFCALDKTLFPNFSEYGMRYCNGRKIKHWYDYKGCTNAEELNYLLNRFFMIRRLKGDVLSQLPAKSRRQIIINCGKPAGIKNSNFLADKNDISVINLYSEAANVKLEPVKMYIDDILEKNTKFIIFAHHAVMVEGLAKHLVSKKANFIKIDGSVISSHRQKMVEDFQNNDNIRVGLLSITACNTGLTLTSAKLIVFAELYWNPGTLLQAEDRIHRIGQNSCVDIHYLVCKGTVDEFVWPVLIKKLNVLQSLGMGKNNLKSAECLQLEIEQTTLENYINRLDTV